MYGGRLMCAGTSLSGETVPFTSGALHDKAKMQNVTRGSHEHQKTVQRGCHANMCRMRRRCMRRGTCFSAPHDDTWHAGDSPSIPASGLLVKQTCELREDIVLPLKLCRKTQWTMQS